MDPVTLILINAGVSALNSWRNSKQAKKLQQKQQEYALAAAERNRQRMWSSMREGQNLMLEIEQENHDIRLKEITDEFDNILKRLAYTEAIKVWPLKVLPIVMKNQSLGTLMINKDENIAMHCILTPSNCESFNTHIFPIIEQQISSFCNSHWNTLSSHPILFYSGAWKSNSAPTGVEIDQLKTNLRSLPTLMITPFFKPEGGLVFNINVWGVGIEIDAAEVSCSDFSYSGSYAKGLNYKGDDDLTTTTIEEFVPYLQCLIGYFADQYFWTAHNEAPILPSLMAMGAVNTDGKLFLREASKERYGLLLETGKKESTEMPFAPEKMLSLLEGSVVLWDENTRKEKLEELFITNVQGRGEYKINSMKEALSYELYSKEDLPFLRKFIELYQYSNYKNELSDLFDVLESIDFDYSILEATDIAYLEKLANEGNSAAMFRLGEIYEYSICVERFDMSKSRQYYQRSLDGDFKLAKIYLDLRDESTDIVRDFTEIELMVLKHLHNANVVSASILLSQYYVFKQNQDLSKAIKYLEEAPETNHPFLYYWAARILIEMPEKKDVRSIEYNLIKSSEYGYVQSHLLLMKLYQYGNLFAVQANKVFEYANKAAKQGAIEGIGKLGYCIYMGYGTIENKEKGIEFLSFAAKKGDNASIEMLKRIM